MDKDKRTVTVVVKLTAKEKEALAAMATRKMLSVSALIRMIIAEYYGQKLG